jgi:hypothetical protein
MVACDTGLADDSSVTLRHNPFRQPDLSMPTSKTPDVKAEAEPEAKAPDPVLRATLSLGRASLADVDGDIIGIGEEVNGYRLLAVNEGSAVFSKDGKRLEFSVGTTTRETRR